MKTTRIVLLSIILAILLTILIFWCAEVLAHGNPAGHFKPYTEEDPCWNSSCKDPDYIGGHGHIDAYDDENGNDRWDLGEENSWGYWTCGGYKYLVPETDCSEPEPQQRESGTSTSESLASVLDDLIEAETKAESDPPESRDPLGHVGFEPEPTPEPESIPKSEPEPEPCTPVSISFDLERGFNLFHLPIQLTDVRTVGGLHKALGIKGDLAIFSYDGTDWHVYSDEMDRGTLADAELGVYTGLVVRVDTSASVSMRGCPLLTSEPLTLQPGLNVVGFPEPPPDVTLVSDLLGLNESIYVVVTEIDGELFTVGRAEDPGDGEIVIGRAYLVIASETITLEGF